LSSELIALSKAHGIQTQGSGGSMNRAPKLLKAPSEAMQKNFQ